MTNYEIARQEIKLHFGSLADEERVALLDELSSWWCPGCGREQDDGRRCQCRNDE